MKTDLAVVSFAIILAFAAIAHAQTGDFVEVPILRAAASERACSSAAGVYDHLPAAGSERDEKCVAAARSLKVDFGRERLVMWTAASDCNMRVRLKAFESFAKKQVLIVLNNIYGGCRAAGWRSGWVVVAKQPEGYSISVAEVKVDRNANADSDSENFIFPKPPPEVRSEAMNVELIDTAGCLPLTGQSRWVISNHDFLQKAIAGGGESARCSEHFRVLGLDLDSHTLVGASFASGYCGKPKGLTISAIRETSSDSTADRIILRVRYDDAAENFCRKWVTYPIWVLLPKFGPRYRFEIDSGAKRTPAAEPPPR